MLGLTLRGSQHFNPVANFGWRVATFVKWKPQSPIEFGETALGTNDHISVLPATRNVIETF